MIGHVYWVRLHETDRPAWAYGLRDEVTELRGAWSLDEKRRDHATFIVDADAWGDPHARKGLAGCMIWGSTVVVAFPEVIEAVEHVTVRGNATPLEAWVAVARVMRVLGSTDGSAWTWPRCRTRSLC